MATITETRGTDTACSHYGPNTEGRCWSCATPLRGRRRFCTPDCGRAWSDEHVWSSARLVALTRAGFRCERCGRAPIRLDVHHEHPIDPGTYGVADCRHHSAGLLVVCADGCHRAEHEFLRFADGHMGVQLTLV